LTFFNILVPLFRHDGHNGENTNTKTDTIVFPILVLATMKLAFLLLHGLCLSSAIEAFLSVTVPFRRKVTVRFTSACGEEQRHVPMVIVFGRPGAGKTTVANKAIPLVLDHKVIGLDLDAYVPQWMKDNFAKGIYPTLEQRQEFALGACDQIEEELDEQQPAACVVSFSFVNTDLRDVFRSRFQNALWALVNTTHDEANKRIAERQGHFYQGAPDVVLESDREAIKSDNIEWDFAPVDFPHVNLPGEDSVDDNALRVAELIRNELAVQA
jgi:gluconate kinase